jgi:hypothetical protein
MKNLLLKVLCVVVLVGFFQSCEKTFDEEILTGENELKSAFSSKISYIVVLNDAELNQELLNLQGYEKRQQAAKNAAERIMKRAGITD